MIGCASGTGEATSQLCPPPIYPDVKVAEELEDFPFQGNEDFWQWMAQIEKLNQKLEIARD